MTTGERYCPECGALLHGEWCSQCGRKGIESLWGAMSWVKDVEPAPGTKGYISRERNKAITERDEARNLARWLWAAVRELLDRYDRVERRGDRWMHKALNAERGARRAALEKAAHALLKHMGELQQKYRVHLDMVGHPDAGLGISIMETNCCAGIVRDLMSSDDEESDVTHES